MSQDSQVDPFEVGMITERLPRLEEWEDGIEPDEEEPPKVIVDLAA